MVALATEPVSTDCRGNETHREDQPSLRRFNVRDQPAVSDVDVVGVAIRIGEANRHGDKPDRHLGSVASSLFCTSVLVSDGKY